MSARYGLPRRSTAPDRERDRGKRRRFSVAYGYFIAGVLVGCSIVHASKSGDAVAVAAAIALGVVIVVGFVVERQTRTD
ncbi:hypothetical protein LQL77_31255 [Rhodococcus cerastii]|nr:hypothetical protein [Rhodococcus cerastii]